MRPFDGYTVLDLSGSVATATCGKLFADFGARVINVEPPDGHPTRRLPPKHSGVADPESSGLHLLLSPGKESVVAGDAEAVLRQIPGADVVLEAETPGALAARGLGFEALAALAPELLLTSISWFGQTGPRAHQPATDATLCCELGLVKSLGRPEGPPLLPAGHPIQVLGGVTAFVAALTHLVAGERARAEGRARAARHLDVSLFESAMCLTEVAPIAFFNGGQGLPRLGLNRFVPTYPGGIFRASDGWVGVTALTPTQWREFCALVGLPELGPVPRYQQTLGRLADADELDAQLGPAIARRSAREWVLEGQARRIPIAPVPTLDELFDSEQLRALDAFRDVEHPQHGALEVPAAPFRLHDTPARRDGPVVPLGRSSPAPARARPESAPPPADRPGPLRAPAGRPELLRGLRVIDLSMGWAGPLAARHLADMGAEVIKVESRHRFDWWRGWEVTPESLAAASIEKSAAFNMVNRNKLGVTLDLESPRGSALLKRLVAISDVVLENYSASVLPKLGLDAPVLRALNPRLVMLSMPPFGAGGPCHEYRAYGSTVEQASGLPTLQGGPDDPPVMLHVALGDPVAGVHGAAALLTAILAQARGGGGQFLDLSQVQAVTHLGLHGVASQALLGRPPERLGSRHPVDAPQGVYRCPGDDQWLALSVQSDAQWAALARRVGSPALAAPELATADGRRARHDAIDAELARWTASQPRDASVAQLLQDGVPAAGVLDVDEVLTHPQLDARGFWQWLEREHVGLQPHPSAPYRVVEGNGELGAAAAPIETPAPTLGEHSREVLRGLLDLADAELDALERDGVIGTSPELPAR